MFHCDYELFLLFCLIYNLQIKLQSIYRISSYSFRGNYSFLNLTLCTVTFDHSTYRCWNYSREETIQWGKLFTEIRYFLKLALSVDKLHAWDLTVPLIPSKDVSLRMWLLCKTNCNKPPANRDQMSCCIKFSSAAPIQVAVKSLKSKSKVSHIIDNS